MTRRTATFATSRRRQPPPQWGELHHCPCLVQSVAHQRKKVELLQGQDHLKPVNKMHSEQIKGEKSRIKGLRGEHIL